MSKADILVIDDNTTHLKILTLLLTNGGYHVQSATDGETALMMARTSLPDLILLDIHMPMMNGYQVYEKLKKDAALQHIPIIIITAIGRGLARDQALSVEGVDVISKPFRMEEVFEKVEHHLNNHKTLEQKNV